MYFAFILEFNYMYMYSNWNSEGDLLGSTA